MKCLHNHCVILLFWWFLSPYANSSGLTQTLDHRWRFKCSTSLLPQLHNILNYPWNILLGKFINEKASNSKNLWFLKLLFLFFVEPNSNGLTVIVGIRKPSYNFLFSLKITFSVPVAETRLKPSPMDDASVLPLWCHDCTICLNHP